MNIYLVQQNDKKGYDTFDSMVVYAKTEDDARHMHPAKWADFASGHWAKSPESVIVTKLGTALPDIERSYVILYSFNAA